MEEGREPVARSPKTLTAEQAWAACELVAESIPHIVWLSHPSGSTDYFNSLGTDYTGFPREANDDPFRADLPDPPERRPVPVARLPGAPHSETRQRDPAVDRDRRRRR